MFQKSVHKYLNQPSRFLCLKVLHFARYLPIPRYHLSAVSPFRAISEERFEVELKVMQLCLETLVLGFNSR